MSVLFLPGPNPALVISNSVTPITLVVPTSNGTAPFISPLSVGAGATVRKVYIEDPTGTQNGSNVTFTITRTPVNILGFYINGMYQLGGTAVSTTVTLPFAPISTDSLEIIYDSFS